MLAYIKLKNINEELYETNFLSKLKNKKTKFANICYYICYVFFEIVVFIKYITNTITVKQLYQAYLFIFPFNMKDKKVSNIKMKKCIKNMQKLMKKYEINTIVLSEELEKIVEFKLLNMKMERKIHILNGKGLMPYLVKEILQYIIEKQEKKAQLEDVYFCIKELNQTYIESIYYLASYFKTINIVTPNIVKFENIAQKIEEEQNCIITVTNNKKKSLKRAKLIVNYDFLQEEIKKYNIYRRAIIIEAKENQEYSYNLGFEGIQIRNVNIDASNETKQNLKQNYLLENYNFTSLYESTINKKQTFSKIKAKMQNDQVKIVKLYGKNGEIQDKQYINIA